MFEDLGQWGQSPKNACGRRADLVFFFFRSTESLVQATFTVPLSTQVYKMVTSKFNAAGQPHDRLVSYPGRDRNVPSCFKQQNLEIKQCQLTGHIDRIRS